MTIRTIALALACLTALLIPTAQGVSASDTSQLAPLLPDAESVGPGFVLVEAGTRNLDRMSIRFTDQAEAETRLTEWGFLYSFYRTYDHAHGVCPPRECDVTVEISMSVFRTTEGATLALPYFAQDRADAIGLEVMTFETPFADGRVKREARLDGNGEYTTYLQMGERLVRVSMTIEPDLRSTGEGLRRVALVDRLAWATLTAET
jgi:hypothetical protein